MQDGLGLFGGSFDVEAEDDAFADEVVGFAGVFDFEVVAVDGELGFDGDGVVFDFDVRGEADFLGHAVQGEVAGDFGVCAGAGDGGGFKNGGGVFGDVEEIGALKVAGEAIVIAEEGIGLDGHLGMSNGVVRDVDFACELLEAALVLASDFGAGEFDFGVFRCDGKSLGTRGRGR